MFDQKIWSIVYVIVDLLKHEQLESSFKYKKKTNKNQKDGRSDTFAKEKKEGKTENASAQKVMTCQFLPRRTSCAKEKEQQRYILLPLPFPLPSSFLLPSIKHVEDIEKGAEEKGRIENMPNSAVTRTHGNPYYCCWLSLDNRKKFMFNVVIFAEEKNKRLGNVGGKM